MEDLKLILKTLVEICDILTDEDYANTPTCYNALLVSLADDLRMYVRDFIGEEYE